MEQSPQAHSPAAPATPLPDAGPASDAALLEELAKWRERVPKLAAALRQRAEETQALRQELDKARRDGAGSAAPSAGIKARDELIEELQGKLAELAERHKIAQGELHARYLTIDELRSDAESWKRKWQSVTRSLDEQAATASGHDQRIRELTSENAQLSKRLAEQVAAQGAGQRALDEAVEERDSLRRRNEQLFETTELANRQIGSLTDSLTELRAGARQLREREATLVSERDASRAELERVTAQLRESAARVQALEQQLAARTMEWEQRFAARGTELKAATAAAARADAAANEQAERVAGLTAARDAAEQTVTSLTVELHQAMSAAAATLLGVADTQARVTAAEQARTAAERRLEEQARAAAAQLAETRADHERQLARVRDEMEQRAAQAGSAAEGRAAEAEAGLRRAQQALDEQRAEVERLTEVVTQAQQTIAGREQERRNLSDQLQSLEARNRHLEQQLAERSALVVTLEQDQAAAVGRREALQQERDELEEALMRAERHVKENAEHVTALDAKLERQKELMENLEEELAETKDELAQARKSRPAAEPVADAGELERLRGQVRKLETLVRERTDELNRVQWQHRMAEGEAAGDAARESAAETSDADAKLMLVLNQQLTDERTRNDELRARVRQLEAALAERPGQQGDDLTRIHGVGHKLAEQLNDLGIYRYQQIAELDPTQLEDENHVLYGHRGRILRDGWIEQAVKLISH